MGVIPNTRLAKIEFYESHLQAWATNAAAIGLDPAAVLAFQTLVTNARSSQISAESARAASLAATQFFYNKTDDMATIGSGLLRTIRNYAETNNDPNVYTLAQIPAPAQPSPVGPPGQPYQLRVGLNANGELELKWKCDNPAGGTGTVYEIHRRIGSGPFEFVGVPGERAFLDETIPAGSASIIYKITAVRSTVRGTPAQFLVNFGVGGVSATALSAEDIRLAA